MKMPWELGQGQGNLRCSRNPEASGTRRGMRPISGTVRPYDERGSKDPKCRLRRAVKLSERSRPPGVR